MSKILAIMVCAALLTWSVALTQEPSSRQPGSQQTPRTRPDMNVQQEAADAVLITWLLVASENEVALARIAEQRATLPEVTQFAQKMIAEHGQMVQKLQQASRSAGTGKKEAREASRESPTTGRDPNRDDSKRSQPDASRRSPNRPGDVTERQPMDSSGVRDAVGALDPQKVIRDLGQKHLQSSTKLLQEKKGADFDRCYMDMQLSAHVKAADMIQVFRNHASDSLRPTLEQGMEMVQAHLQHAKDLARRTEHLAATDSQR